MEFRSSYLSEDGALLKLNWNDTSPRNPSIPKKDTHESMEIDDAAWVMSSTFMIFGKFLFYRSYLSVSFLGEKYIYKLANW